MSRQEINIGLQGNDGTGESIREAFRKVNENFSEVYGVLGITDGIITLTKLGDWTQGEIYKSNGVIASDADGQLLSSKRIEGEGGINVSVEAERFVISSDTAHLYSDPAPRLGGPLNAVAGIARIPMIDESTNFGLDTVAAFNQTFGDPGPEFAQADPDGRDLAVNKAYVDDNFIKTFAGVAIDPIRVRSEPTTKDITDPDYDPDLTGNWVSTEALPRKSAVRRQGDTMQGLLTLHDHPDGLAGLGTPLGDDDLQAATKLYVDKSSWASQVNLFVSTNSGDDTQSLTPPGKEGRHWNYAYKTVGAAALAAENLISLSNYEPGPYKQSIIYSISPDTFFSTVYSVDFVGGNVGNTGYEHAYELLVQNKAFVQAEIIAYINTKYVNKLNYDPATCRRDVKLILDAVGNDLVLQTNYNSVLSARQYYQAVAANVLNAQLIQTIDGINYAKQAIDNFKYDETTCKRDVGYILDAIGNDLILYSNFQTIRAGLSYYQASASNVIDYELAQTIGALTYVRDAVRALPTIDASATISEQIRLNMNLLLGIIENGTEALVDFELPESPNTPTGASSSKDLLLGNIKFIQAEVIGFLSANYPTLGYSKEICKRDAQYMVWAVAYDLMYGGNTASIYAGNQYYSYGGGLNIALSEKTATIDAIGYIKTIAKKIVQNLTPDTVYQQTYRQYKNSSLTNGVSRITDIDTLFNLIADIVANGVAGHTEVGFDTTDIDPDLLSAQDAISAAKETIKTNTITYINANFSVINSTNAINGINTNFGIITNALDNGLSTLPDVEFTYPGTLGTGFQQAAQLIQDNYDFIRNETIGYIAAYDPLFDYNGDPVNGPITCSRDVQYLLEAILYDLIYGGNTASVYAAQQYYAGGFSQLPTAEKTITIAALTYTQSLCVSVATNTSPANIYAPPSTQTSNPAYTLGNDAVNTINNLWNDVLEIIDTNPTITVTSPSFVGYDADYIKARTVIQASKNTVAQSVTDYLDVRYAGGFSYDEGICFRDVGYLIDAAAIDLITGGTWQSVNAGKSYYRNVSAKSIAIGTQYTETLDAINYALFVVQNCLNQTPIQKYQTVVDQYFNVAYTASTAAKNYVNTGWGIVTTIIQNGIGAATTPTFGSGTVEIKFTNGGTGRVDQGNPNNVDLIPGKVLIGETSNGNATIVSYTQGGGSAYDTLVVRLLQPIKFTEGERLSYAETVRDLQITIFVESGIYYEDYPIRLSQNVSIKGNDFRRTIIRPRDRISQSPWRKIFFYRDAVLDGMILGNINRSLDYSTNTTLTLSGVSGKISATLGTGTASRDWIGRVIEVGVGKAQIDSVANNLMNCSTIYPFTTGGTIAAGNWHIYKPQNYGRHYLTNPDDINSSAKNNKDIDVFLVNDATRVNNLSMQGHGGFAMVLDPEGQILSKSPYGQVCSSFSGSLNTKRFAGGQFVDGFTGRLKGTITAVSGAVTGGYTQITVKGGTNSGLDVRAPNAPSAFFWQGFRYQINNILSYDQSTATVVLGISNTTPWPYTVSFAYDQDKCARDVGLILDAVTYDLATGANYQSYAAGLSYLRSYSSNVTTLQKSQTIAGINKARDLAIAVAPSYSSEITTYMAIITNIINTGESYFNPSALNYPNPSGAVSGVTNAKSLLIANRQFIRDEIVAWIDYNYAVETILNYDAEICSRDVGYVVDAIIYDLLYGGNSQTVDAANAYYNAGGVTTIAGEQTVTAAAYNRLKAIMQDIAQNINIVKSSGNTSVQTNGTAGSSDAASTIGDLVDIIVDVVQNGLSAAPARTAISVTSYGAPLQAARTAILANRSTIQLATIDYLTTTYGTVYNINLEMGGNKSMLANDFAMVNDLGYGIVAGNGALTEQVSTFTYYCHTHYWSFNGGQIRSVAGSNAHGNYALRATGYDVTELPDAVSLSENLTQTAKIYKASTTASQMNASDKVVYISNYDSVPQNISELEIDHSRASKSITRYEVTSLGRTPYYVETTTSLAAAGTVTKTALGSLKDATFTASGTSISGAATYTGVTQSATSGSGSSAVFTITKTGSGTAYSGNITVTMTTNGSGYVLGDTITIPGASLGGSTPTNNLTLTIASIVAAPYSVTYALATQTAPTVGVYYTVTGNSNIRYNGNYLCTASSTTSITLRYTYDPGTVGTTGFATTSATSTNGITVVGFATQSSAPFATGSNIYVKGVTPVGYNGVFTVISCTTSSVTFAATVSGNATIQGIVSCTSINAQNILQLNLGTSGNNDTSTSGLSAALYHQQNVIIKTLQYFKFDGIANVNPTRPSTALQFDDNLAEIYRVIAYNLTESTGETLVIANGAGQSVLSTDTSFNYYKITHDPARVTTADPTDSTKTMGANIGDTKIAVAPIASEATVAQINKGTYITAYGGRVHKILSYTPTTGNTFTTSSVSGDGTTATVSFPSQAVAPFAPGSSVTVVNVSPVTYNGTFTVVTSGVNFVTYASTAIGSQVSAGSIYGGGIPAFFTFDSAPLKSTSQSYSGITISGQKLKTGTGPYYVTYSIPTQTWPVEVDQYMLVAGNTMTTTATSVSSSDITVTNSTGMAVGGTVTFSGVAFGSISTSTTYYITKITGNVIQMSTTKGGTAGTFGSASGSLTVTHQSAVNGTYQVVAGPQLITSIGGASGTGTVATVTFGDVRAQSVMTATSSTGNKITLASSNGVGVGSKIQFTSVTQSTTATNTTSGTATMNTSSISSAGVLTVGTVGAGTITVGMMLSGGSITANTVWITANLSGSGAGSTWQTNTTTAQSSTTITGTLDIITVASNAGMVAGETITFTGTSIGSLAAGTYYVKQVLSSGTQISVSATYNGANFSVGSTASGTMTVLAGSTYGGISSATTTLSNVIITGGSGTFSCTSTILFVNQQVVIAGTNTGTGAVTSGTYYIITTNGSTTFTLSTAIGGAAITTTAGTPASLTYTVTSTYYVATVVDNQITISTNSSLTPILTLTNGNGTWTSACGEEPFVVGSVVTVEDIVPAGYNGNYTITACTYTSISYASTTTGLSTVSGRISAASSSNKDRITLAYTNDPGIFSNATTTSLTIPSVGIDKPFGTSTSYTMRVGYAQGTTAQITVKISTTRVTGHDFLDIGTGGYNTTNYPYQIYGNPAQSQTGQAGEVYEEGVGRVFYVTTDQNGIFRVGRFFTVDQGTGTVTFSASIALSNLDGIGFKRGVVVSEFSTDSTMTNNASEIVPVQSAVRGYIDRRLGIDHGGTAVSSTNLIGKGYLSLGGDLSMKGSLNMASHSILNVTDPSNDQDAATKLYVDTQVARFDQLSELRDTGIAGVLNGNHLIYDTVAAAWKNVAIAAGTVSLATQGASGNGTVVTLTFASQASAPFAVGSTIIVTGVLPSVYNGSWTVSTCTTNQVTFLSTASGAYTFAGTIIGNQINTYYSSSSGRLVNTINAGVIVDAAVAATAAINQTKVAFDNAYASVQEITGVSASGTGSLMTFTFPTTVTPAFTVGQRIVITSMSALGYNNTWTVKTCTATTITADGSATGSGTGGVIRPLNSVASFDTANFTASNGWVSIKTGSIQKTQLANIGDNTILGLLGNGGASAPVELTPASVLNYGLNGKFGTTVGAVTNSATLGNATITPISSQSGNANTLVLTNGDGIIDVSGIKIGTNTFVGLNSATIEMSTPNGIRFIGATGSAATVSGTTITVTGTLDASTNAQIKTKDITTGGAATVGNLIGAWTVGASSSIDLSTNNANLKTRKIDSGATATTGTITGAWSLATSSTLDTSSGTLTTGSITANGTMTVAAAGIIDLAANNATLKSKTLTTGATGTVGYITGDWQLNAGSKMQATYADLAEFYSADKDYEVGTVLVFGGDAEVTTTTTFGDTRVAGVVSENPAYTMNASLQGTRACLALQGRVPVKVLGTVKKGDLLTTAARAGYACKAINPSVGTIIGKALADKNDADVGIIEVAVGRL